MAAPSLTTTSKTRSPPSPLWTAEFADSRPWYHYVCPRLRQSRFLSAFNLTAPMNAPELWVMTDELPSWGALRCGGCGERSHGPGGKGPDPPAPWCARCGEVEVRWLPVTEEPHLTITWFPFGCTRCGRRCVVGNDPRPVQCIHCLTYAEAETGEGEGRPPSCLLPLPTGVPTAPIVWIPERHHLFPPSHCSLVRILLLANNRASEESAGWWLPEDLLLHALAYFSPGTSLPSRPYLATDPASGSDTGSTEGGMSASSSRTQSMDTDPLGGIITPPSFQGSWRA